MLFAMAHPPDPSPDLSLEDRQAIVDATIRYCWAIDARAYDDLDDVFVDDVHIDYGSVSPPFQGRDRVKQLIAAALDPLDRSQHLVGSHLVECVDGEVRSRCYFQAQHVREDAEGGPNYIVAGIYRDKWRRTDVGWRSIARELEVLWTDGNPAVVAG